MTEITAHPMCIIGAHTPAASSLDSGCMHYTGKKRKKKKMFKILYWVYKALLNFYIYIFCQTKPQSKQFKNASSSNFL